MDAVQVECASRGRTGDDDERCQCDDKDGTGEHPKPPCAEERTGNAPFGLHLSRIPHEVQSARWCGGEAGLGFDMTTLQDFSLDRIDGRVWPLADLAGQVVLIVNVASECGFTPQYAGLEELWRRYRDRGLVVIGCPCNQFGGQEPGAESEIVEYCSRTYDVTFPMTSKLDVNGDRADPLWQWLKQEKPGLLGTTAVKWNFTKFLVGRDGRVLERFASTVTPEELEGSIERAL